MENAPERKARIKNFIERWQQAEGNEDREARSFLIEFLQDVLGIDNPTKVLDFERRVKGRKVDAFYEDMGILIEAKSREPGILDKPRDNGRYGVETPYQQAKWYANEMPASIKPRWIIVTDFDEFRIHDLDLESPESDYITVKLEELVEPRSLAMFDLFFDKSQSRLVKERELSIEAGEIVGKLYDAFSKQYQNLDESKEEQRSLNVLIVRLVFLLYAEDAGLLQEHHAFLKYMKTFDANQSRQALMHLFKVLDTPVEERDPYLRADLAAFPYINGSLFAEEGIIVPQFTEDLRVELLLHASQEFDWKDISPTIFGAVFESTLNPETRRAGGMHYTSIENIHKVIDPLFLDGLKAELAKIEGEKVEKTRMMKLRAFQSKLSALNIFDPACGSGNFLTESYIQLRRLENRVLENIQGEQVAMGFGEGHDPIKVSIKQFYGIEINDFAVSVAKTALWIAESQMLDETQNLLMQPLDFFPLTTNATIVEGNALRMDWNDVLPAERCSYIIGNPPFRGARWQSESQKSDILTVFHESKNSGNVDYVAGWYMKAAEYIAGFPIKCAFVSTNSICQGEQVANIWRPISDLGINIYFAYDTFRWSNEATGQAHVFCVIVGFSNSNAAKRTLFHHSNPDALPEIIETNNINFYLSASTNSFIWRRSKPISNVPLMSAGNKPVDGGNYLFTEEEKEDFISKEPTSAHYFHPWMGAVEFINNKPRYVLWLGDLSMTEIDSMPRCKEIVNNVRDFRLSSSSKPTQKIASTPNRFHVENIPRGDSIVIPQTSSGRRTYIPMGFLNDSYFCSDKLRLINNGSLYLFGILSSLFHNAWVRVVAGRLKADYTYSEKQVYNNFVFPDPTPEQRAAIEQAAQAVLDARDAHPGWTLADLYDPDNMPADLLAAHKALDAAVEAAYGVDFNGDEEKIVAHLFKLYAEAVENEG